MVAAAGILTGLLDLHEELLRYAQERAETYARAGDLIIHPRAQVGQVADGADAHRSYAPTGAKLFIVD